MTDAPQPKKSELPIEILTPSPRLTPWAVWSLAFGLGSFCLGFIAALPAFIFAAVALSKIKNAPRAVGGKGVALAGLITGGIGCVVGTFILIGMALPVLGLAREKELRDQCEKNVAALSAACARYVEANKGAMPNSLKDLDPFLVNPPAEFKCPSAKNAETAAYELLRAGENVSGTIPSETQVIRDSFPHHRIGARPARVIGYLDGRTPLVEEAKK